MGGGCAQAIYSIFMIDSLFSVLAQAAAPTGPAPSLVTNVIQVGAIMVIAYVLLIRGPQKRQKEQESLISSVKVGDSVVMSDGMHGLVSSVKESTIVLKVQDNVKIEFDKVAIAKIAKSSSEG